MYLFFLIPIFLLSFLKASCSCFMEAILSLISINPGLGVFPFSSPCYFLFISSHCLASICLWCWRVSSTVWWPLISSSGVNPNVPAGSLWVWGCTQGGCGPAGFLWGDWQVGCRQTGHAAVARGHRVIPEMFLIPCPWVGEGPSPGGLLSQSGRGLGIPQFTELIFTEFLWFSSEFYSPTSVGISKSLYFEIKSPVWQAEDTTGWSGGWGGEGNLVVYPSCRMPVASHVSPPFCGVCSSALGWSSEWLSSHQHYPCRLLRFS